MPRAAAVVVVGLLCAGALAMAPALVGDDGVAVMVHDDSYYYANVARHLAAGDGFTFDGRHRSNGFHLLWVLFEAGVFAVVPGDVAPLRALALLQAALVGLAAALLFAGLRDRIGTGAAAAGALTLVALPDAHWTFASGMEPALALLALVILWRAHDAVAARVGDEGGPAWPWAFLGLLVVVAFLARLELLAAAPALALLERRRFRRRPRLLLAFLAPVLLGLAAYLIWNRTAFGVWLPISGVVKSTFAGRLGLGHRLESILYLPWVGRRLACLAVGCGSPSGERIASGISLVVLATLLGLALWRRRDVAAAIARARVGLLLLSCALFVAGDALLVGSWLPWYVWPIALATALVAGLLAARLGRFALVAALVVGALVALRGPRYTASFSRPERQWAHWPLQAARWVDAHAPPDAVVGSWNAGTVGYYAGRTVINLDGLANDRRFFDEVLLGRRFDDYAAREGIGWIVDSACSFTTSTSGTTAPEVLSRYLTRHGSRLTPADFELAAHFHEHQGNGCPGYAVWKLRQERAP